MGILARGVALGCVGGVEFVPGAVEPPSTIRSSNHLS